MGQTEIKNLNFKSKDFVHLHLHTDYSLLHSSIQLKPLAKKINELDMKACAITDYGNMYGAISFYQTMKSNGIHPIIGYEAYITFGSRFEKESHIKAGEKPYYNLLLLAKDLDGYQNLVYLASKAFVEGFYHKPRIDLDLLSQKSNGLIALSSGLNGAVAHFLLNENEEKAEKNALLFKEIFGQHNFYIEIQDHNLEQEVKIRKKLVELSAKSQIPLVATNDAHYLNQDDAFAQEVLMAIGDGKTVNDGTRKQFGSDAFYLRSADEMWRIFGDEVPEALTNSLKIAETCQIEFPKGDNLTLPTFPIPKESDCQTNEEYFEKVVMDGFEYRKKTVWEVMENAGVLKYKADDYKKRIEIEIETIKNMKFPGYFLIVWDFIKYAKQKNIPVGPGRGSAAGSLVAYCLEITDVDPLQYDLLFERFLNPERISMPDIDIDFCVRGRGDVINHVTELYGRDSVCQIITFGTMASKAAIKDVGRALNMPLGEVEKVAKLIPPPVRGRNVSISQALEQASELKKLVETNKDIEKLVNLAMKLEGCSRHSSVHAAGVVISPKPLHEIVPVAVSNKSELTSQFTMNDLEKVGMLKMDFLALTTLTIISDCLKGLKEKTGVKIDWSRVPLDDEKTMSLFGDGKTEAVFQFESSGMQEICRRLKPKELEDLAALNALYRPGPLDGGMVDDFILRHRGEKRVQYIVSEMKEILQNTYGILVYQEQIMQIAQKLGGYSLGEADMMRRAMGKKKREEMALHKDKFISGAVSKAIKKEKAEEIFNLMAQFADYGFNRSHSVAYAYLAFQTAYLKAHYAAYFYASVLSNESQDSAKIYKYTNEMKSSGVELLPPDINESDAGFTPMDNAVRFGLNAIKGIGASSVQAIIEVRGDNKFTSIADFAVRVDQGTVNRRAVESLITAGAFDSLKPANESLNIWRARNFAAIDGVLSMGQKVWQDKMRGQTNLFDSGGVKNESVFELPDALAWSSAEMANLEKNSIGFYLTNHPLDVYATVLSSLKIKNLADYEDLKNGDKIVLAGIVSGLQIRYSKKGNRFGIFRLEDQSTGVKCLVWSESFNKFRELLKDEELLIVEGRIESSEGQEFTMILDDIKRLADAIPFRARNLCVELPDIFDERFLEEVFSILSVQKGNCEVILKMQFERKLRLSLQSVPLRIQGARFLEDRLVQKGCKVNWVL